MPTRLITENGFDNLDDEHFQVVLTARKFLSQFRIKHRRVFFVKLSSAALTLPKLFLGFQVRVLFSLKVCVFDFPRNLTGNS